LSARQYDICQLTDGTLAVVVQDNLLEPLETRVVVPLIDLAIAGPPLPPLNPVLTFGTEQFKLMPQMIVSVPSADLAPRLGSVAHRGDAIKAAVAALLGGLGHPPAAG
jgi:toxin CcdB